MPPSPKKYHETAAEDYLRCADPSARRMITPRMPDQRKIIGIAGGLGPYAHIDFERKLLEAARRLAGAEADQDFPEWIVSSVPQTPDRTGALHGDAPDPGPFLLRSFKRLESGRDGAPGADFIVTACNTAHLYIPTLRGRVSVPILDMVDETCRYVGEHGGMGVVGLLATTGMLESRLYHDRLAAAGLTPVSPLDLPEGTRAQEDLVMTAIYGPMRDGVRRGGIKAVGKNVESVRLLEAAASRLVTELGAGAVIAACTEVPVALDGPTVAGVSLIDPACVLAEAAIRLAYGL